MSGRVSNRLYYCIWCRERCYLVIERDGRLVCAMCRKEVRVSLVGGAS